METKHNIKLDKSKLNDNLAKNEKKQNKPFKKGNNKKPVNKETKNDKPQNNKKYVHDNDDSFTWKPFAEFFKDKVKNS